MRGWGTGNRNYYHNNNNFEQEIKADNVNFLKQQSSQTIISDRGIQITISDNVPNPLLPFGGINYMHIAAYYDSIECLIYLISLYGAVYLQDFQFNPLHYSCYNGSIITASYLIEKYPELLNFNTGTSYGTLCVKGSRFCPEIIKILYANNYSISSENNPFDIISELVKRRQNDIVKIILSKPINKSDKNTPLMAAVLHGAYDLIPIIIEANCCNVFDYTEEPYIGVKSALSIILFIYNSQNSKCFRSVKLLLKHLAQLGALDSPENEGLEGVCHWICRCGDLNVINEALKYNFRINRMNKKGETGPKYFVDLKIPDLQIIQMFSQLIQKGFNINEQKEKMPPLIIHFIESRPKKCNVIAYLIDNGADLNQTYLDKSNNIRTPKELISLLSQDEKDTINSFITCQTKKIK